MTHYTTIEQGKRLMELGLSPESADMFYCYGKDTYTGVWDFDDEPTVKGEFTIDICDIPCWSIGALWDVMPDIPDCTIIFAKAEGKYGICITPLDSGLALNEIEASAPIEACYNMIVWLLENGYIKKGE